MFSAARRRVIVILLVSSMLLITLDLRGNAAIDGLRSGFSYAMRPFEVAGEVIAGPIERTWAGITEVDDLREENAELREIIDGQRADQIYAQHAISVTGELQDLIGITQLGDYDRVPAAIIGDSATNFDQTVEIDVGSQDGVRVGMPVTNSAGLIGHISEAYPEASVVRLVTDTSYYVRVKVVGTFDPNIEATPSTAPSGVPVDELEDVADSMTTTTVPPTTAPPSSGAPASSAVPSSQPTTPPSTGPSSAPGQSVPTSVPSGSTTTTTTTTTTTLPLEEVVRETGLLRGYGGNRLPHVEFVADAPQFGRIRPGDAVLTSGGRASLAPPDIPVGVVSRIISTGGSEGLQLEVDLAADLSRLNYLQVVLFQPPTELENQ